jgi:hypothetical protein
MESKEDKMGSETQFESSTSKWHHLTLIEKSSEIGNFKTMPKYIGKKSPS